MIKICFFGDSVCTGQFISVHNGWISQISSKLTNVLVINSSVNGRTTRQALEDMPYNIQSIKPEILIIQFGINDSNYWENDNGLPRVHINAFMYNLQEMIDRAFAFNCKHLFLNTNHPIFKTEINYRNNFEYNKKIRRIIKMNYGNNKIELNDIEKEFLKMKNPQDYLLEDKVHINEKGHGIYFDLIFSKIKTAIANIK